jgi:hypothetical protein
MYSCRTDRGLQGLVYGREALRQSDQRPRSGSARAQIVARDSQFTSETRLQFGTMGLLAALQDMPHTMARRVAAKVPAALLAVRSQPSPARRMHKSVVTGDSTPGKVGARMQTSQWRLRHSVSVSWFTSQGLSWTWMDLLTQKGYTARYLPVIATHSDPLS